jgi:signal transduction histidine kinase/ActR/RegA family two-component response regulator
MTSQGAGRAKPPRKPAAAKAAAARQGLITDGYALAQMVEDLRKYQAELEIQNQALRYSQLAAEGASERFITLFSSVPLALMVVDELGQVVESNAMALRLFRPQEHDRPLNFLLPTVQPKDNDRVAQAMALAKEQGSSITTEVEFLHGSQGTFVGDLHVARIESPQDELAQFICGVINQTPLLAQRHELEESAAALRQRNEELYLSENRLAAIINSSLDAIICVDASLHVTVFNPAAATLFDCPTDQALGHSLERFLPEVVRAPGFTRLSTYARRTYTPSAEAMDAGAPARRRDEEAASPAPFALVSESVQLGEMQARTAQGKVFDVEISVSCERQPRGDVITIFARDLTARNKAQEQKNALESQLRQSQKMQAMGTMAGGIAHDFNNILSAILGNVELAKQDLPAGSVASVSLAEIDKAGRRARDLVRQILTFSRNDPPKRAPVQLADVVHETTRLLKTSLPPSIAMELALDPAVPAVLADATQVEQALLNLCTNAMQAIGNRRGAIRIELTGIQPDAAQCARLGLAPGHYARLTVKDSGEGMDSQVLQRIFEPFFTTKQVGQGTGLGLAVVHGIMRSHLGTVDVNSTQGAGSAFTLYFPTTTQTPSSAGAAPASGLAQAQAGRNHVMYVDDDQALVFLVQRVLKRQGFQVSAFSDPHAAEAALRADPAAYDLLVTDYNMPGYSGVDLLREAKAIRADLPVALASGYVTAEIEQSALREGASALIHKPNDVSEFCDVVQRLLRQHHAT